MKAGLIRSREDPLLVQKCQALNLARQVSFNEHTNEFVVMMAIQHREQNRIMHRMMSRASWRDHYQDQLNRVVSEYMG